MNKISRRALSALIIAALVIVGLVAYVLRYVDNGRDWALYFSRANSGSSGAVLDRNGVTLASFDKDEYMYSDDWLTRMSCYHLLGDYEGRIGTGVLSSFWNDMQGFSLVDGTTKAVHSTLRLTVDSSLNCTAYNALGQYRNGAVMVSNYKTGEVLCMVSAPAIDPTGSYDALPDGAYINRCISSSFTPGSVFKLIPAAAAIENIPDIYDRAFDCEGGRVIDSVQITCIGKHKWQTFEDALANSCNCAFADISVELGYDTLSSYAEKYGFCSEHTLSGIRTAAGSCLTEDMGNADLAWAGIGQSTDLVCPYTMLRFVSAIANDGILAEPTILKTDEKPHTSRLIEQDTAKKLGDMMSYNVIAHYGAENFPGLDICAKTGTAELGDGTSHAWFVGFLDDPDHPYAFVVMVERGGGGLAVAGSVANTVLQSLVN